MPTKLKPVPNGRTQAMLARIENAADIEFQLNREYVVKEWIDRDAISCMFGEPGTGKSFLALDIGHHVQRGAAWNGCRVRQGNVLYIAAEGGALFANRVAALERPSFFVLAGPVNLPDRGRAMRCPSRMRWCSCRKWATGRSRSISWTRWRG